MKHLFSNLKKRLLLLVLIMTTSISYSQEKTGNLTGVIKNSITNKSISNVKVILKNESTSKTLTSISDANGIFSFKKLTVGKYYLKIPIKGFDTYRKSHIEIIANQTKKLTVKLIQNTKPLVISVANQISIEEVSSEKKYRKKDKMACGAASYQFSNYSISDNKPNYNTESYNSITENGFRQSKVNPLSTFSIDVDAASYSNVRRFLMNGQKPEKGAVRVEEMINYFQYDYPNPEKNTPFSITTEIGDCPWSKNKLVHIGLQGKRIAKDNLPASNLVFLLDVSGSMNSSNKLPLLKKSFKMLVNELGEEDRIAIVVYAGAAGVVLKSTPANKNTLIMEALDKLQAGGSTAGGAGIELAYKVAQENFIKGGNNRVILATDGDFNIGMSSNDAMENLIVKKRETGIFLTCLGFGTGNFKDSKMEALADKGNGNYAYIDNIFEAKKVLVTEMGATLVTLAKDVKIQVEFNPNIVASYRLIGYENRLLNEEDFNDDTKDAGEIGAGHSVTALYEIVLVGEGNGSSTVDALRYQDNNTTTTADLGNEILTVKFRYKEPNGDVSKLIERNLNYELTPWHNLSNNYKFSAAVAEFGMLLRNSKYIENASFSQLIKLAKEGLGEDKNGYRAEFIKLVDAANTIYSI